MLLGWRYKWDVWLLDWNVYHAAAVDLADRNLYRVPLVEPGFLLPTSGAFNYPPVAAAWALPLLPLEREVGGMVWILACGAAIAAAGLPAACSLAIPALVVGLLLIAYTRLETFAADVLLANDNHIMLVLSPASCGLI